MTISEHHKKAKQDLFKERKDKQRNKFKKKVVFSDNHIEHESDESDESDEAYMAFLDDEFDTYLDYWLDYWGDFYTTRVKRNDRLPCFYHCQDYLCHCQNNMFPKRTCEAYYNRTITDVMADDRKLHKFSQKYQLCPIAIYEKNLYTTQTLVVDFSRRVGMFDNQIFKLDSENFHTTIQQLIPFSKLTPKCGVQKTLMTIFAFYLLQDESQKRKWRTRTVTDKCIKAIIRLQARVRGALFRHNVLYNPETSIGSNYIKKCLKFDEQVTLI